MSSHYQMHQKKSSCNFTWERLWIAAVPGPSSTENIFIDSIPECYNGWLMRALPFYRPIFICSVSRMCPNIYGGGCCGTAECVNGPISVGTKHSDIFTGHSICLLLSLLFHSEALQAYFLPLSLCLVLSL